MFFLMSYMSFQACEAAGLTGKKNHLDQESSVIKLRQDQISKTALANVSLKVSVQYHLELYVMYCIWGNFRSAEILGFVL